MNESELKELWRSTNEKLDETIVINRKLTEDITRMKVRSFIGSMKTMKVFTLVVGILWVGVGVITLSIIYWNFYTEVSIYFLLSATVQVVLTSIALLFYLHQLIMIYQVDLTDSIINTQVKLALLKVSTLNVTRILFLQLPVWATFWWNETMFKQWNIFQMSTTILAAVLFTSVAIWLFHNIKYENRNKKWFKLIFDGKEWTPLMKSMELLEQLEEYETQEVNR